MFFKDAVYFLDWTCLICFFAYQQTAFILDELNFDLRQ